MSYDLYFLPGEGSALSRRDFLTFFEARENYSILGGADPQASYENENTGVTFSFEWSEGDQDEDVEEFLRGPHAAFNLNFYRPDFFSLEALPELEAFVLAFGGRVHDPQTSGMGDGVFSKDGFLNGWRAGNSKAHQVFISRSDQQPLAVPKSINELSWCWNFGKEALQQALGEDSFVPRVFYFLLENERELKRGVVWTDGIPMVLPSEIDVLVLLKTITQKRFMIFNGPSKTENIGAVPAALIRQDLPKEEVNFGGNRYTVIGVDGRMSAPIDALYSRASKTAMLIKQMLTIDQVLDRETVEAVPNNSRS